MKKAKFCIDWTPQLSSDFELCLQSLITSQVRQIQFSNQFIIHI